MKLHRQIEITSQRRVFPGCCFTGSTTVLILDRDSRRSPVFSARTQAFSLLCWSFSGFLFSFLAWLRFPPSTLGLQWRSFWIRFSRHAFLHIYFRFTFVWGFKNIVVTDVGDWTDELFRKFLMQLPPVNHHQLIIGSTSAAHLHSVLGGQIV